MDLYHKKVNVGNRTSRNQQEKYMGPSPSKNKKNIYLQKMIPQNENLDIASTGENIQNVRSSMEDIFSNEDTKKKAIKYVINIGKNKSIHNSPKYEMPRRFEKSASPNRGRGYPINYGDMYDETPNRRLPNRQSNNRTLNAYNTPATYTTYNNLRPKNTVYKNNLRPKQRNYNDMDEDEYYDNQPNYINVEESQNDFSSMNEDDRIPLKLRNVEPRTLNRVKNVLNDTYERAKRRIRTKDINAMSNIRKKPNAKYTSNMNINTDEDIDELIRTVDYLQSIINGQKKELRRMKKDNDSKDKELDLLKNELDNMEKELEDKRIEHDKEIDEIYKNNDNNEILKKEYYKLLQDYDNNINDYNNLKDDYNKMVDEYNILKNEKNKLNDDNKNLKHNNNKLKDDLNKVKNEANKALEDYNNIVDDYNKLEKK